MKHLINDIQKKYHARGFRIIQLHADLEFEKVREDILPIRLMTCGKDDHVPEVERSVQTQKNENRAVCHAMPYRCLPRIMIRELIKQGNAFLNAFGSNDAVGNGLSPRNIIDNLPHIDAKDLKYEFGEYVQLHIQQQRTNTMSPRTIGAIVLGPRNILGLYNFMSLETGQQIDGRVVARLPISTAVIERVEAFGREQNQPFRISKLLQYEWRPGTPIADDDTHIFHPNNPTTKSFQILSQTTPPTLLTAPYRFLKERKTLHFKERKTPHFKERKTPLFKERQKMLHSKECPKMTNL